MPTSKPLPQLSVSEVPRELAEGLAYALEQYLDPNAQDDGTIALEALNEYREALKA